jgi:hypothetical protein
MAACFLTIAAAPGMTAAVVPFPLARPWTVPRPGDAYGQAEALSTLGDRRDGELVRSAAGNSPADVVMAPGGPACLRPVSIGAIRDV